MEYIILERKQVLSYFIRNCNWKCRGDHRYQQNFENLTEVNASVSSFNYNSNQNTGCSRKVSKRYNLGYD